jgi:hypothetical protein
VQESLIVQQEAHLPMPNAAATDPGARSDRGVLDDPRTLTILTTEHWSLLSARSLVYNEAFSRASMFLTFLSATLVALGLISTATGFSRDFLSLAAVVLAVDLFLGLATVGRVASASSEDIRYLQGMARIRHAYAEIAPGVEAHFSAAFHDDPKSVLAIYGTENPRSVEGVLHGFTTTPGMLTVICSVIGGSLIGVVAMLAGVGSGAAALSAVVGTLALFAVTLALSIREISSFWRSMEVRYPADPQDVPRAS